MTQPAVVMRGSAPRDYADTPAAVTVDGKKLPRVIPVDKFTATVTNPSPPQIALPTRPSRARNWISKLLRHCRRWQRALQGVPALLERQVTAQYKT